MAKAGVRYTERRLLAGDDETAGATRSTGSGNGLRRPLSKRASDWLGWRCLAALRWLGHRWIRPLGVMTEVRIRLRYWPNLFRPKRLTEHLARVRAFPRFDQLHVTTADKYAARQWVADRVGARVLNRLHQVADSPEDIDFESLPSACVIKATHVQGGNLLIPDKSLIDPATVTDFCRAQLTRRFGVSAFEDFYLSVPPRLIVEDWLGSPNGHLPDDYKFFVFHGVPAVVLVGQDRHGVYSWSLFDTEWNPLRVRHPGSPYRADIRRPAALDEMVEIASQLGREFEFCRIDLYNVRTRVVFGEITHTPAAGYLRFDPPEFDAVLGRLWSGAPESILDPWREFNGESSARAPVAS